MKKQINLYLVLSLIICIMLQSCKKDEKQTKKIEADTLKAVPSDTASTGEYIEMNDEPDENVEYPEKGKTAKDFAPYPYEIQYEANGDLNSDGLSDAVIVLTFVTDNKVARPMLVLLRQKDNTFRLDKISKITFPIEYNEHDFKFFDTEDIDITKGKLNINLYSIGPSGNIFAGFKYMGNDLVLTDIEGNFRGAGGGTTINYDYSKGEITTSETNTMEEDMPTETKTEKTKKTKHLFENTSIVDFFNDAE